MSTPSPFRALHQRLLLLPNAWDAGSARVIESSGASAIATTSAAVAWAQGAADGEHIALPDLLATVRGIVRAVRVPVSVDLEAGYGDPAAAVAAVIDLGAVGINLEDGAAPPEALARAIDLARGAATRAGVDLFINARTDVYLRGLVPADRAVDETLRRGALYRAAGADGLFVPGATAPADLERIVAGAGLPVNVLASPRLPAVAALAALGVRRLSVGCALAQAALGLVRRATQALLADGASDALFAGAIPVSELNALFATGSPGR